MVEARLRRAAVLLLAGVLAACASSYLPVAANGAHTASPPGPLTASVSTPSHVPKREGLAGAPKADLCGAAALAYMIGRPRAELPVPADLSRRRVVCSTCAVEGSSQADRQTILYDSTSQRIVAVTCG